MLMVSTGRNRLPSTPVGSRLRNRTRTGRFLLAMIVGPRLYGLSTPKAWTAGALPTGGSMAGVVAQVVEAAVKPAPGSRLALVSGVGTRAPGRAAVTAVESWT